MEAIEYFKKHKDHALSDKVNTSEKSIEFVESLYKFGAKNVDIRPDIKYGWFGDLYVMLKNKSVSKEMFNLVAKANPDEFDFVDDNTFRIWWD